MATNLKFEDNSLPRVEMPSPTDNGQDGAYPGLVTTDVDFELERTDASNSEKSSIPACSTRSERVAMISRLWATR